MKNAPAFLFVCILLSGCVTGSRPDSKPDKPGQDIVKKDETVVLLHGQGRSRLSMVVLGKRFRSAVYQTLNVHYNHKIDSLDEISDQLIEFIAKKAKTTDYHLIGHSLGNVIIRNAFRKGSRTAGRSSLAPPNQPAHLAKLFKKIRFTECSPGTAVKISQVEFYRSLPVPKVPFGVIAGDKGQSLTFSEPNDAVVTVESTKLDGMTDWILLPHGHTFIMNGKNTFEQCRHFLEQGSFKHSDAE